MPPMSAPRPIGSTTLQTAFVPRIQTGAAPALAPPSANDGRVGRIGEMMGKLGFPLSADRVAREERARATLPSTMPIAWLLGVEWVRANDADTLGALVTLTTDITSTFGGALDLIDATGATFVFFGLGSQGACVLAAQELRERLEALADGRPDAPSLRLAVAGSRLRAEPDHAAEGDAFNALQSLLRKAQPGQSLLARNLANGVADLVATTATLEEVQLTSRKPSPARALPTVAFEPVLKLLDLRISGLERGIVAPVVITGARRSGRTHLAFEFARRASNQKVLVGFTTSLKGERAPLSSLAELVCQLCEVPFDDRHTALGPAMEKLGVAPIRREAMLAALQLAPTPAVFTTNQVVDALRLVLADLTQGKARVLVFDALDQADEATVEVVRVLLRAPTPKELVVVFSTPTHATSLPVEPSLKVPTVSAADVDALLQAVLQTSPAELRDVLLFRAQGLAGVVVDLLLLTLARGAIRPKGESLALEGAVPDLPVDALVAARLAAEGSRCGRLLEAVWLLGDDADAPTVAQVLPGVAQEQWPRAFAARLLSGVGGRASVAPAFAALVSKGLSGPGLASRAMQVVQPSKRPMPMARAAQLLEGSNDAQRAGAAWRDVAERAAATRNIELTARAQEGMARVLRRHPQRDLPPVLANRMQLWARVACIRLGQGDVAAARRALNEGLDVRPRGGPADPELSYAQARVAEAEGQVEEASEALAEAFAASKGQPIRAAVLALLAQTLEAKSDPTNALDTWHQALAAAEPFLPHAPWFGEVDFRGRVEARIGALFITQTQGSRARTWLVSAAERFKAANAPLFAARVMANVGTLSMQLSSFADAAQWFGQAAATAESGGDFLFQSKQLLALSKVLARQQDPRSREVAQVALGLAEALGWDEGSAQLRELAG